MSVDLKSLTPSATLPAAALLFGAVSGAAAAPTTFTVQDLATALLGGTVLSGATVTASAPVFDLAQTWNAGAVAFTGLRFNATDTASAAGSLLLDLQVGGSSKFSITKDGSIVAGSASNSKFGSSIQTNYAVYVGGANATYANIDTGGFHVRAGNGYYFSPDTNSATVPDIALYRDAAGILAQQNGTNAQSLRVYNTWSSSGANYERGVFDWQTTVNVLTIGTQAGGTGVARDLALAPASGRVQVLGGTVTASAPALDISQTWNAGAVAFTGLRFNATDTASAAGSLLLDLQVGGSSQFKIDKTGNVYQSNASNNGVSISLANSSPNGHSWSLVSGGFASGGGVYAGHLTITDGTANKVPLDITSTTVATYGNGRFAWSSDSNYAGGGSLDLFLARDAAGALAIQNGTSAQSLRVYNSWGASGVNYERGAFDWQSTANVLSIGTQNGGTGVARNLQFVVGGVNKLDYGISNAGSWTVSGASYLYFGGSGNWNGFGSAGGSRATIVANGQQVAEFHSSDFGALGRGMVVPSGFIGFATSTSDPDAFFTRIAAGVVALKGASGTGAGVLVTNPTVVASLPAAATAGVSARAFVTDATATLAGGLGSTVAGGGANKVPVYSDGTNWLIG